MVTLKLRLVWIGGVEMKEYATEGVTFNCRLRLHMCRDVLHGAQEVRWHNPVTMETVL